MLVCLVVLVFNVTCKCSSMTEWLTFLCVAGTTIGPVLKRAALPQTYRYLIFIFTSPFTCSAKSIAAWNPAEISWLLRCLSIQTLSGICRPFALSRLLFTYWYPYKDRTSSRALSHFFFLQSFSEIGKLLETLRPSSRPREQTIIIMNSLQTQTQPLTSRSTNTHLSQQPTMQSDAKKQVDTNVNPAPNADLLSMDYHRKVLQGKLQNGGDDEQYVLSLWEARR